MESYRSLSLTQYGPPVAFQYSAISSFVMAPTFARSRRCSGRGRRRTTAVSPSLVIKSVPAAIRAEVVAVAIVVGRGRSVGGADLHPANGGGRIADAAPETIPMTVQPVQAGEQCQKSHVEEGGVVPLKAAGHDLGRTLGWNEAGEASEAFDDQPSGGHDDPEPHQHPKGE